MVRHDSHSWIEYNVSRFLCYGFIGSSPVIVHNPHHLTSCTNNKDNDKNNNNNYNNDNSNNDNNINNKIAPVFIANHITTIDAPIVYMVMNNDKSNTKIRFKWIAKISIKILPGVGVVMWLSNHLLINRRRKQKKSSSSSNNDDHKNKSKTLYEMASDSLTKEGGIAMFIFPQGTRRLSERLPFKDGAFRIAMTDQAPIIPISIDVPPNTWNTLYPFLPHQGSTVIVTVHPPISTTKTADNNNTLEQLKQTCSDIIYSVLPPVPMANISSSTSTSTTSSQPTSSQLKKKQTQTQTTDKPTKQS